MAEPSHRMNRPSPPSPGFSTIRFEKRDRIAWITLNRPRQLNAYNVAMRDDLFGALSAVHDDPEVRAMVLCGAGPAFSTGGDVSEFGPRPRPRSRDGSAFGATYGAGCARCRSHDCRGPRLYASAADSRWRSCAISRSRPSAPVLPARDRTRNDTWSGRHPDCHASAWTSGGRSISA